MDKRSRSNLSARPDEAPAPLRVLDAIFRRYRGAVRAYVVRNFGMGPPDPEDVVQSAFEKFAQIEAPGAIENPYTFLVRCARNHVIDQRRRQAVRAEHAAMSAAVEVEIDDMDAERVLSARERYAILARAIESLDPRRREMLLMNRVEGLSFAEIARLRSCSPSLVKLLVAEALAACREAMDRGDGR